ncbi:hypothetical protein AB0C52_35215 [Streptomyces sp. NPDC048717]|uniref:hypothetical protein n=1 Tax=Streptomyces sp. NPDC048717 TaxID=3154928 RepID=UPI00343FDA66
MATPERDGTVRGTEKVSMRELLAACAAAEAVSTPPGEREIPRIPPASSTSDELEDRTGPEDGMVRDEAA